jgi:hypothetical protein
MQARVQRILRPRVSYQNIVASLRLYVSSIQTVLLEQMTGRRSVALNDLIDSIVKNLGV